MPSDTPTPRPRHTGTNYHVVLLGTAYEVLKVEHLNASSDDVAVAVAREISGSSAAELWAGTRLIERLNLSAEAHQRKPGQ